MPDPCPHCAAGHPRILGEHWRLTLNRGQERLGPCTAPDEEATAAIGLERFHERVQACRDRIEANRAAAILGTLPAPTKSEVPQHFTNREPGEDDD